MVVMQKCLQKCNEFFSQSSIHGLSYLTPQSSVAEKLLWIIAILTSLIVAGVMIRTRYIMLVFACIIIHSIYSLNFSLIEAEMNPISTNMEMISVDKVPFPAITVNSDSIANPWGFIEKSFNMLAFDSALPKINIEKSKKLRKDFRFLTLKILRTIYEQLYFKKVNDNWTLKELKMYKDANVLQVTMSRISKVK